MEAHARASVAVLAFVHLGQEPPALLAKVAEYALAHLPTAEAVLITDHPEGTGLFPGQVQQYSRSVEDAWLSDLERRFPEKRLDSGGYWIKTLERLFALDVAARLRPHTPIIHIESDVYSCVNEQVLSALTSHFSKPALPRLTEGLACPSIVFAPSGDALQEFIGYLREKASSKATWFTDMELLSEAIDLGHASELPTLPERALELATDPQGNAEGAVIFDALALGQYLFGQDPFHTDGVRLSGHIWPTFTESIREWTWGWEASPPTPTAQIAIETTTQRVRVANIHLHAKLDPGLLQVPINSRWKTAVCEANGELPRTPDESPYLGIQRSPAPLWARLRAWRGAPPSRLRAAYRYRASRVRNALGRARRR